MTERDEKPDRITRCKLAIHDLGTRDGVKSGKTLMALLKKEGFTDAEIAAAAKEML